MQKYWFIIFFFAFKILTAQTLPENGGSDIAVHIINKQGIATVQISKTDTIVMINDSTLASIMNKHKVYVFDQIHKLFVEKYPDSPLANDYRIMCKGNYDSLYFDLIKYENIYYENIELSKNIRYIIPGNVTDSESTNFKIFPNPFRNKLYLQDMIGYHFVLFSIEGKEVANIKVNQSSESIETQHLREGIYQMVAQKNNQIFKTKIIKK